VSYSASDFMDEITCQLGIHLDTEDVREVAGAAVAEILRLKRSDAAFKARPATTMNRMLYLVAPTNDQCSGDNDGTVNADLFVWATDASEAVDMWRNYYELDDDELGVTKRVRVFECPIMPNAATSTAVKWDDVHVYGATTTERSEI
jgi:hypothetical protein